ncbi:F510_1955 family glycosylhydrolase [Paenibacillus sp.]|uniref:F510_1955 family glycosylhydrolase n=1 Tax=Paenibacillus sp. TaxID=58172 RepID=UPI002D358986|nr:glycosyl hydrolase [Paenibacillus sp.]HZG58092.1 glycosyl hydrolase [Paenibacillus sp.]
MNIRNTLAGMLLAAAAVFAAGCGTGSEPANMETVTLTHVHGLAFTPDGKKLIVPAHDGLKQYEGGAWAAAAGPRHDYMGFSMADDGFYSSGHPEPGSELLNPLGIVKSRDEGERLEILGLHGETDFHLMTAGYASHVLYVFNPGPNSRMQTAGLHYTTDEAKTWSRSHAEGLRGEPLSIAAHPSDPAAVAVGTDKGLFVSRDSGHTFEPALEGTAVTALHYAFDGRLYAGGVEADVPYVRFLDAGGTSWSALNIPVLRQDAVAYIARSPTQPERLAFATFGKSVYLSADGGATWDAIAEQGEGEASSAHRDRAHGDHDHGGHDHGE